MAAKRILIIEDDVKSRYALRVILETLGHSVLSFHTAEEAAASLAPFDTAIIDIRLPKQQGPDLALELQKRHPRGRIIFVTAYDHLPELRESHPDTPVLVKPLDIDILKRLL